MCIGALVNFHGDVGQFLVLAQTRLDTSRCHVRIVGDSPEPDVSAPRTDHLRNADSMPSASKRRPNEVS